MKYKSTTSLVLENTLFQLLGRIISSGSTFVITLLVAKELGVVGYGDFSKAITFVPFFFLITDFGLNASYLRLSEHQRTVAWKDLLGVRLLLSLAAMLLCLVVIWLLPQGNNQGYTNEVKFGVLLYSAAIFFHGLITTYNVVFQKALAYKYSALALAFGAFVSVGVVVLLPLTSTVAIVGLLLGTLTTTLVSFFAASRIETVQVRFSLSAMKILLRDAAPLTITLLFNLVYFRIDSIILTLTRSTAEVGAYNLAYKFFEFPLLFPVLFMNSLFPIMLKQTGDRFLRTVTKAAVILGVAGCCCTLAVLLFSPVLQLLRSDFSSAVPLLQALSLAFPFFFLSNLVMWLLITKQKNRELILLYGSVMVFNILGNLWFIPTYGAMAAVVITIAGEASVLLLGILAIRRFLRYDHLQ